MRGLQVAIEMRRIGLLLTPLLLWATPTQALAADHMSADEVRFGRWPPLPLQSDQYKPDLCLGEVGAGQLGSR